MDILQTTLRGCHTIYPARVINLKHPHARMPTFIMFALRGETRAPATRVLRRCGVVPRIFGDG